MELKSTAFENQMPIPKKYTYDGDDISPPLSISDVPKDAQSFALIVDDPDAPTGTFDHWVAWNISPEKVEFSEGESVPMQGKNDFGELRYRGPAPPPGGPHRYFFKLYALNAMLELEEGATKEDLESAIEGHILDQAELIGTYQR